MPCGTFKGGQPENNMSLQWKNKGWMAAVVLSSLMAGQALAVEGGEAGKGGDPGKDEGGGIMILDGGMFYPSIGVSLTYDDNILRSNTNKKSSTLLVLTPRARLEYDAGEATRVAFEVDMERGVYFASSSDNYLDVALFSEAAYLPTQRLGLYGRLGYKRGHEARGTAGSDGRALSIPEPDRFHVWSGEARVSYGIEQKLELGYVHEERGYDNNRKTTILQDRQSDEVSTGLSMRLAPNTTMTLDLGLQKINYDVASLDSTEMTGLVGVRWEATYQTTGLAKVGWQKKNMSSAAQSDASGVSWVLGVDWKPLSYSTFQLATMRDFGESDGVGSYQDTRSLRLAWKHSWSDVLGTQLSLDTAKVRYGGNPRKDTTNSWGIDVEYQARPSLLLGASLSHSWRNSNRPGLDYKDNQLGVKIGVSM